jgi:hypothetical protein
MRAAAADGLMSQEAFSRQNGCSFDMSVMQLSSVGAVEAPPVATCSTVPKDREPSAVAAVV